MAAAPAPDQTLAPGAAWSSCTAGNSCVANVPFNGNPQSTRSAPYYDYTTDSLYVGDNSGRLHEFTGVFDGTPAEVTTGWPITVHSGAFILTGPVYDSTSGNIFVGDSGGQLSYVRESGSTVGACASGSPPCLGSIVQALGGAIVDAPIVDGTTGRVLAFEGTDTTTRGAVFQFDTALTSGSQRRVSIGSGTTGSGFDQSYIYSGTFDEAYYDSADGTGRLLVCGKTPQGNSRYDSPALHRITFTAGIMNTVSDGFLTLTNLSGEECSPVTQIMNGSTEWLFFSVGDNGGFVNGAADCPVGTPNGCIMSLNYSALAGTWPPTAVSRRGAGSRGADRCGHRHQQVQYEWYRCRQRLVSRAGIQRVFLVHEQRRGGRPMQRGNGWGMRREIDPIRIAVTCRSMRSILLAPPSRR